uniref:AT-hook transcription factor n=1 Tax=Jaculus jaculus TaxID=51337 RepID=A0A8C5KPX9_JACJA
MASSGTEMHWARSGLGKGPRRRRWAWTKDQDGEGNSPGGWRDEQPLPEATSPELLEDFRRTQQQEWNPDKQESEGSSGEETEADDVRSPEGSTQPLPWPPGHDEQLDLTELDEDPGNLEVEEAGEKCQGLYCEDQRGFNTKAVGQGRTSGRVTSDKQASGHRLSEHPEIQPSIELSVARTWSSGTVSLGHPSDSLDSTSDGETDVLQPTTVAEALPKSLHHHVLCPDDRTGGSVARAIPAEFQNSLATSAQNPQRTAGTWGQQTTSLPSSQPEDQTWKPIKASPKPLPSRFTGSTTSLSPQLKPAQKVRSQHKRGSILASHSSSDVPKYGQGRLNYPLPDLSKVGPRVKFPKDESYRPPKSRGHSREVPAGPLIFKSPAEIVREVLLSSGEASLATDPLHTHPVTRVPQEFQTPEQATELVHQLQEDYHKLLTKYAEAENTIDQLRLGAKVNLYWDPPQPSQSAHAGMVSQGTKVFSFTIPQPQSAERWSGPPQDPRASKATGWPPPQGAMSPSSPPSMPTSGWVPEHQGIVTDLPSTGWTQVLASQASQLLSKVESFEQLVQAGHLPPQDQLKGFRRLRAAHTALEEGYLRACQDRHRAPQLATSKGTPGTLNPCRELEAEIFRLGVHLEDLQELMDQTPQEAELCGSDPSPDSFLATPFPHQSVHLPVPLGPAASPASTIATAANTPASTCTMPVNEETSPCGSEVEGSPWDLPTPLRDRGLQVEQDFHGLLERYLSMKSLPEALKVEEDNNHRGLVEGDGAASSPGKTEAPRAPSGQCPALAEESHRTPVQEDVEQVVSVKPPSVQTSMASDRCMPCLGKAEAGLQGTKSPASHQSSMTSLEGSGPSEHVPCKALVQAGGSHVEEPWMASPETDSGFVGSETSRVSPLTQTPEHRLSHFSSPGTSARCFTASAPHDRTSHPKARGPVVSRRAIKPNIPRSQAQRHLSSLGSPLQPGTHRSCPELCCCSLAPSLEFEGQSRISEQLRPGRASGPALASAPASSPVPHRSAESTPDLLLTKTERDKAIRELQAEVSRLRLQLEDSLHRPPAGSPTRLASTFDPPTQSPHQPEASLAKWHSQYGSKSTERLSREPAGAKPAGPAGRRRSRSSSVPREVPRLSLSLESELHSPRLTSENKTTENHPREEGEGMRAAGGLRQRDRVSFRGQYTGQEYHALAPKAVLKDSGSTSCPHCQPTSIRDTGKRVNTTRNPLGPAATDTLRCHLCGHIGSHAEAEGPSPATSGRNKATLATPNPKQKSRRASSPAQPPPGLWYLAAAPPALAPPALAYISSVPVMPYPPATVYYATPAPTSAATASSRPGPRQQSSAQLGLDELEELHEALSQAVRAAEDVRSTTRHMSRSLSADLRHARGLRGSCLF